MAAFTFDEEIISDLYKDAYNVRPKSGFWAQWNSATDAEKQAIWDGVLAAQQAAMAEEDARQAQAVVDFSTLIETTQALMPGISVQKAIEVILQPYEDEIEVYGVETVEYELGLPRGHISRLQ